MNTTAVQEAVRAGNEVGYMVPLDLGPAYADPEPRVPRQPERPHNSHSIIHTKQLPGPLAMQRLLRLDALYELDEFHAVTAECAHTLYGRGMRAHSRVGMGGRQAAPGLFRSALIEPLPQTRLWTAHQGMAAAGG